MNKVEIHTKTNRELESLVGRSVRLKGKKRTAKIEFIYDDIIGGVKLDRQLDGYWSWNMTDLEVLP